MKIEFSTDSTLPSKEGYYWQIVVIPTISILRYKEYNGDTVGPYTVVDFEWLFWSATILIK